jgi:hypothetical protein
VIDVVERQDLDGPVPPQRSACTGVPIARGATVRRSIVSVSAIRRPDAYVLYCTLPVTPTTPERRLLVAGG